MRKLVGAAVATAALFISAAAANAATVYQSTFQGATFTFTQTSATTATFDIAGVDALTGNWSNAAVLDAFSFKGLGTTSITALRSGVTTAGQNGGLAAGGCNGSGNGYVCFDFTPDLAANVSNLTFDLTATGGAFNIDADGPHFKILWLDSKGKKAGDLYSDDLKLVPPTSAVPEPATWAMMITGFGLAGAAMRRRRGALAVA